MVIVLLSSPGRLGQAAASLPAFLSGPGRDTGRRCVLVLVAHYDDDSTIAGTISLYQREGWDVHLAWVTAAGLGGPWWGTPELRRSEAMKAVSVYGLDDKHWHILGFKDHETIDDLPGVCDKVTELIREIRPSVVITDAYEGGHWDHDSCSLAAYVASRRVDFTFKHFEIPTYNTSGPWIMPWRINNFMKADVHTEWVKLDREGYQVRKGVRRSYKSQWFFMVPFGILGTERHLRGRGEPIRESPKFNYLEPPHPGKLLWQRPEGIGHGVPFDRWQKGVEQIPEFKNNNT